MKEPLLATKESDVLVVVHLAFRPFLNTGKIKLQRKIRKIFFHYCTQNKLKETELLLNK